MVWDHLTLGDCHCRLSKVHSSRTEKIGHAKRIELSVLVNGQSAQFLSGMQLCISARQIVHNHTSNGLFHDPDGEVAGLSLTVDGTACMT